MNNALEEFAGLFRTEDDLQQEIAALLRRIDGVSGVQVAQGPREHGKDVVFYRARGLGELGLYACVIKNTKISGVVSSSSGAKTVLFQAEQALDEPWVDGTGKEVKVDHVYVMSPRPCSQEALDTISNRLAGRPVEFVCGSSLYDLFQTHYPEFLTFASGWLQTYIANLKRGIEDDNPLKYLADRHTFVTNVIEKSAKVYIPQDFEKPVRSHTINFELPRFSDAKSSISRARASAMKRDLLNLIPFAAAAGLWFAEDEPVSWANIESTLIGIAKGLVASWDKAFAEASKRTRSQSSFFLLRHDATVVLPVAEDLVQVQETFLPKFALAADKLRSIVGDANHFANLESHEPKNIFGSTHFLHYCVAVEVSQRIPDVVRAGEPNGQIVLPHKSVKDSDPGVVVSGPAGYGKSSYCRWNVLAEIEQLNKSEQGRLPVYVPLHELARRNLDVAPEELFFQSTELRRLLGDERYNRTIGEIRLYLDGLDEVPSSEKQEKLIVHARKLTEQDKRVRVVVTTRDHVQGAWLNWLPRVQLSRLTEDQAMELAENLLGDNEQFLQFSHGLLAVPALKSLMFIPLLNTLIVSVFRNLKTLPENKISLYEMFVDLISGGWDLAKNVKRETRFGAVVKNSLLSRLAGQLHTNALRYCGEPEIRTAMNSVMPGKISYFREMVTELIADGLLVQSGARYYFSHLSFQEYLAARDFNDPAGRRQTAMLQWYLGGNDWWREVLLFYISMQPPRDTEAWIRKVTEAASKSSPQNVARVIREYSFLMEYLKSVFPGYEPGSITLRGRWSDQVSSQSTHESSAKK